MNILAFIREKINKYYVYSIRNKLGACGLDLRIYSNKIVLKNKKNIYLGSHVKLNENCYLNARGKSRIVVGNNSTISAYAKIITASYEVNEFLFNPNKNNLDIHLDKDIYIGDYNWIGMSSIILPGVRLEGRGIIVAAGSVVTKSFFEDNILIGGNPAQKIKKYIIND